MMSFLDTLGQVLILKMPPHNFPFIQLPDPIP
jgi:hypothetical protein